MISTAETARRLGVKVPTVYAYVSRGLLPRHRVRGHTAASSPPAPARALTVATVAARAMLLEAMADAPAALSSARRALPAGFGHPVYPAVDPRARCLVALLPDGEVADALDALVTEVALGHGAFPTMDLALAATTLAHRVRPEAAQTIFSCARTAGWVAHALEEAGADADHAPLSGRHRVHGLYGGRAAGA